MVQNKDLQIRLVEVSPRLYQCIKINMNEHGEAST
jgi:hypothetical protein